MIYDKRKGSLLNFIQMPLNVITPEGTYLGLGYAERETPQYILSHIRVKTFRPRDLIFSELSKNYIMRDLTPILEIDNTKIIGYGYEVSDIEIKTGYITVESKRIYIDDGKISKDDAAFLLEKQLRNIGNVLQDFIFALLGQPQWDALLVNFFYGGFDDIEENVILKRLNDAATDNAVYFTITDMIQTNIKFEASGYIDENLTKRKMDIAKMFSYVPGI